jgi:hypothetical protein
MPARRRLASNIAWPGRAWPASIAWRWRGISRSTASGTGTSGPAIDAAASWTSQARCSDHSVRNDSGTLPPVTSRPWLRRISTSFAPRLATRRRCSSRSVVTPSKSW